jgi:hypothetical protein
MKERAFDHRRDHYSKRQGMPGQGEVAAEAHSNLCITCTMEMIETTEQKIIQYFWNIREKWTKTIDSLRHNLRREKSIT